MSNNINCVSLGVLPYYTHGIPVQVEGQKTKVFSSYNNT